MRIVFENIHGNDEIYMDCLRAICGDTAGKSMIDLGCNLAPHTPKLGFSKRVYVDILDRKLDHVDEQKYFVKADMLSILRNKNYFDVSMSLDSLEHLSVTKGAQLISLMELYSGKQIIFTPLNEWMMDLVSDNPEGHHSIWTPDLIPDYASIIFPIYHPTLNIGAWFGFNCKNLGTEFQRVASALKTKTWYNYGADY